jgi:hypothetical protein
MPEKPLTIDDRRFNEIIREALSDREEEAARESGIDLERARELSDQTGEGVPSIAAEAAGALDDRGCIEYQLVQGHLVRPVVLLRLTVKGVASVSPTGTAELADEFLVAVTIEGRGHPKDSRMQILTTFTPIWHPQVSSQGEVTLVEAPSDWCEAIDGLRRLIAYEAYDCEVKVLNSAAAAWAREHESLFPLTREHS